MDTGSGLGPQATELKYDSSQPRKPAGNPDGGEWTNGGGGRRAPASTDEVQVAISTHDTIKVPGSQAPTTRFNPSKPGWHEYNTSSYVCAARLQCTKEEIADHLSRFAVPGQDPSQPMTNGATSDAVDSSTGLSGGKVMTTIGKGGLEIKNKTLPGHIFFDGVVVRTAIKNPDGSWTIKTRGYGNNIYPGMNNINELLGPGIFDSLDQQLRENIERHHGITKSILACRRAGIGTSNSLSGSENHGN